MTLEEAKKILKKEVFGIRFKKFDKPLKFEEKLWIRNEKPEVLEALHIVAKNGIGVSVPETTLRIRRLIIKKMKTGEGEPAPVSGTPLTAAEGMKLQWKDNKNTDKNPALAEAASQFNDALLDEQAKEIERLKKENAESLGIVERMKQDVKEVDYKFNAACKESERLNEKIRELIKEKTNLKDQITVLNACKKHNDKIDRKQIKCLGKEIAKLNGIIHDKNAILSDVAEELRLSKIREKNLVEVSQKYMKENEELKKKLEKMTKLVETVRKGSKEYCEYGIAAEKMIQKMAKEIVNDSPVPSKDYKQYRLWANGYRFNPQLPELSEEEEIRALKLQISALEKRGNGIDWKRNADAIKLYVNRASHERLWNPISQDICNEKELSFIINHGGKRVKYALHFDGTDIVYECSDPDKKSNDLMVGADIAEEGGDNSGVIVLCGKDFIDAIKKMK